jgi:hypothetical protein
MPIKKYKTFQEAREDLWNFNPDEEWLKKAFRIFDFPEVLEGLKHNDHSSGGSKNLKPLKNFLNTKILNFYEFRNAQRGLSKTL